MAKPQELAGVKALLACPTYGHVDPLCQKSLRVNMMSACARGLEWVGDASPDRLGYQAARNQVAQVAYDARNDPEDAPTGIMWVDSDIKAEGNLMSRLIYTAVSSGIDLLSGVYHYRKSPYLPVFTAYDPAVRRYRQAEAYDMGPDGNGVIGPIGACGFGFVWTSLKAIVAVHDHRSFDPEGGWFPDTRTQKNGMGEDFAFCEKARKAGIQLYIDTGVQVIHCGDAQEIGREDFLRAHTPGTLKAPKSKGWGSGYVDPE